MDYSVLISKIKEARKILILPSQPADLDCLCSALIMNWYIYQLKKDDKSFDFETSIFSFFQIPQKIKIYPEMNQIEQKYLDKVNLPDFDLIVGVDGNGYDRFLTNSYSKFISQDDIKDRFIKIDHHQSDPTSHFLPELNITESNASSTTLVIYKHLLRNVPIPPNVATWIYTGIVSDTGNFRWNFSSETLKIAAELIELHADHNAANNVNVPVKEIEFNVWAINHTQYFPEIKTTLLYIDKSHYEELDRLFGAKWDFKDLDRHYKNTFCKVVEGYDYYFILKEDKDAPNVRITWRVRDLPEKPINLIELIKSLGFEAGGHLNSGAARAFNVKIEEVWTNIKNNVDSRLRN